MNEMTPDNAKGSVAEQRLPDQQQYRAPRSIRRRLLALAWGMTIVAIALITAIAIDSANNVSRQAQLTSSQSLRVQAEKNLAQINASIAEQNNLILDRAARDVHTVASTIASIYDSALAGDLPAGYWPPEEHIFPGPEGQYLNGAEDTSSVFVPVTALNEQGDLPAKVLQDIEVSAYLDPILEAVFQNNPNASAIYLGSVNDVTRYYPNIELGTLVPSDFQVTQRPWYVSALEDQPGPVEGGGTQKAAPIWSPVYLDATGLGLVTTVAVPAYDQAGELIGVIGLDLTLDEIRANIEQTTFFQNGYSFLIDQQGQAIILPEQGYQDILKRAPEQDEFSPDLATSPEFAAVIGPMIAGGSGFETLRVSERELFVAYAPLESTGWSLGSVVAAEDVLQSIPALQADLRRTTQLLVLTRVLPAVILIAILLVTLALIWTNRLVDPIQKLAEAAQRIGSAGSSQWDFQIPVRRARFGRPRAADEIDLLANTLSDMTAQLRQTFAGLEQRVADRTSQLEYRTLQLQTAAEVGRDITSAQNLEQMLQNAVDLISSRFGYYNVGVFLVDEGPSGEMGNFAQLQAASGEVGAMLVSQKIRLKVGEQGIIGYVAKHSKPRIVPDVSADDMYLETPLLPNTRSEAALPLRSGAAISNAALTAPGEAGVSAAAPSATVIGVLDVQSAKINAFDPEDVIILQTLADQLAIAIENTRLVARLQATIREASLLFQQQVREAWLSEPALSSPMAFEYDRFKVRPVENPPTDWMQDSDNGSQKLIVPVKLREQVIGFIGLERDNPSQEWTDDEVAIVEATANQAALTVENARLLAESQQRAAREQIVGEVASQMRASLDMDIILQTAIREIAEKLGVSQVEVRLGAELKET
ncbi:MAG: GAF domain-containing protein [Anaerolineales bacterium]|nr:GAF domain-containing protein [Anaerolineales bacterium]